MIHQSDREAAAKEVERQFALAPDLAVPMAKMIRDGDFDDHITVLSFAQHREAQRERDAKVAECHSDDRPYRSDMDWNDGYIDACHQVAQAIRTEGDAG